MKDATTPIEDFCWSVIFELRQPMTAISSGAQRAKHLLETDPRRAGEAMDEVVEQIARMDHLLLELYQRERRDASAPELTGPNGNRHAREGVKT